MKSRNRRIGGLVTLLQAACWALPPSRGKNRLLRALGHDVALNARLGPSIVVKVRSFHVGDGAHLGLLNVFRGMSNVHLEKNVIIESWNWVSAHPAYQLVDPEAGTLYMGVRAKLGSRNYLDCSGTIAVRAFGTVGGNRCVLVTHQPDFVGDRQTVGRITVGNHAFVGSCAVLLKGAALPDRSILAANSTMLAGSADENKQGLYAGSPASWKRRTDGDWFSRSAYMMSVHIIDQPQGILDEDCGR